MNECHRLSDWMPAVALGAAEWTPDEAEHLRSCGSCQAEWDLVQSGARLGQEAGLRLDAASTAQGLLLRLERARLHRHRRRAWGFAGVAAAAAVAAVVWTGRPTTSSVHPAASVVGFQMALPELDSLQPAELDSVLQTMDEPAPADSTLDDLEGFLDSWEG
jgi:hypothetical protein